MGSNLSDWFFVILCLAVEIQQNIECFRGDGIFPNIVIRYEREIWVEFVQGRLIKEVDAPLS